MTKDEIDDLMKDNGIVVVGDAVYALVQLILEIKENKQIQANRLYESVSKLALMAGEDTDETIDWLCGKEGGMFKLFENYFSPRK